MDSNSMKPTQWAAIRSQRGKTALAAKALWDVVLGLEPDGRTDGGLYIRFYRIAQTALRHFRDGTRPSYEEQRPRAYGQFEAILSALADVALETARNAYVSRSRDHKDERKSTLAKTPKKPKAAKAVPIDSVRPKKHKASTECVLCGVDCDGKYCSQCGARQDEYASLLAARGPLTVAEIDSAIGGDNEDGVLSDLQSDERFVEKDGKWSLASSVEPASPHLLVGAPTVVSEDDIDPFADEAEAEALALADEHAAERAAKEAAEKQAEAESDAAWAAHLAAKKARAKKLGMA